jgi:tetratricopeptide (TPR) repeat protein
MGAFFLAGLFGQRLGAREPAEEVDRLALATLLITDGHLDRADKVLAEVDPANENIDAGRLHTLRAIIALHKDEHETARQEVDLAQAAGATDPNLYLLAAQAHYGLGQLREALARLDGGGARADALSGAWLLRAECNRRLGDRTGAWQALGIGASRFPENSRFQRQQVFLLIDAGLFQEAVERGRRYLDRNEATVADWIALGEALARAGRLGEAASLLEEARMRYDNHPDVLLQLAHTYLRAGRTRAAAVMFEIGARRDPSLSADAAELYRRAGDAGRALMMNAEEPDQSVKLRQRMGLLVDLDRFEEAAALEPRLRRHRLLQDEEVAYALAYALYRTGRLDQAEKRLKVVKRPELFDSATALREAMGRCQADPWMCE